MSAGIPEVSVSVSVVVGVRNGGDALGASLASVLSQAGPALELIVVNDGSTDDTARRLEALAAADPRLRVRHQSAQGLTVALRQGCAEARGEFIARHDADDLSLPDRLARQVARLRAEPELAFVSCWCRALGPRDELLWEVTPPAERQAATQALVDGGHGPPHHGSVLMRRAAYERAGGYRPQFYLAQDSDLWLRLAEQGAFAHEPAFLYAFRVTEHSLSARHSRTQLRLGELSRECHAARRAGRPEAELLAQAAALRPEPAAAAHPEDPFFGPYFIARCLLRRRDPRARPYALRALRARPWSAKAWLSLAHAYTLPTPSRDA